MSKVQVKARRSLQLTGFLTDCQYSQGLITDLLPERKMKKAVGRFSLIRL